MKFWECDFNLCHMVLPESIRVPATICHAWLPKGSPHIMPMCTFAGHRARRGLYHWVRSKGEKDSVPCGRGILGAIGVASCNIHFFEVEATIYRDLHWVSVQLDNNTTNFLFGILPVRTLAPAFVDIPQNIYIHMCMYIYIYVL